MTGAVTFPPAPLHAVALTRAGAGVAQRLAEALPEVTVHLPAKFEEAGSSARFFDEPVARLIERLWPEAGGFLLVMASGIAVRAIAPLLEDKTRDPAVLVFDPNGAYAVPLLSGHLGGANGLALTIARKLGMQSVITTATDVAGRPAAEVWARDAGFRAEGKGALVRVNAAWADDAPVGLYLDPALGEAANLPAVEALRGHVQMVTSDEAWAARFAGALIAVTHRVIPALADALFVRPPVLSLGVGCRLDADPETVARGVRGALEAAGLSPLAVARLASVDVKENEPALLRLAEALEVAFTTYPANALKELKTPTPSQRVEQAVGTPSVSEAAALLAAGTAGRLLLPKRAGANWTLAVAMSPPAGGRDVAE